MRTKISNRVLALDTKSKIHMGEVYTLSTFLYTSVKGNVRVYIDRMLMSTRYYSIAHAYESIFEIYLQFVLIL